MTVLTKDDFITSQRNQAMLNTLKNTFDHVGKIQVEIRDRGLIDRLFKCCPEPLRLEYDLRRNLIYLAFLIGTLFVMLLCYFFKRTILIWLYASRILAPFVPARKYDETKKYDAFVLYESKNKEITKEYVNQLEKCSKKYRLRYVDNDCNQETILEYMMESKEIIVLMNRDYLLSSVCRKNFYLALQGTSVDKAKQMIIVLYPDVGNIMSFGRELKAFVSLGVCIKRNEFGFWSKLKYALPHRTKKDDDAVEDRLLIQSRYPPPPLLSRLYHKLFY